MSSVVSALATGGTVAVGAGSGRDCVVAGAGVATDGGFADGAVDAAGAVVGLGVSQAVVMVISTKAMTILQNWIFRAESFMMRRQ